MNILKKELDKLQYKYENMLLSLLEEEKGYEHIDGNLSWGKSNDNFQYYHLFYDKATNKLKRKYINSENIDFAQKLAYANYLRKMIKILKRKLKQIEKFNKDFNNFELDEVYENLHIARKNLINIKITHRDEKIQKWKSKPYTGKTFFNSNIEIYTNKGERVRSKSEKILADIFYSMNIEYKYECPLFLNKKKPIYPDFTFYNPIEDKEIYWEHFGMMDDEKYLSSALFKIENYVNNDILLGEQLIITFESSNKFLDTNVIKKYIDSYLKF